MYSSVQSESRVDMRVLHHVEPWCTTAQL